MKPPTAAPAISGRAAPPSFSGMQKTAAVMLAIGAEASSRLLAMMAEDEIREISAAMARLGTLKADVAEQLCTEFANRIGGAANSLVGSFDTTERLLLQTLPPERVAQIMEDIRGPAGRTMWDKLSNVNEAVLASYLKGEYPQTAAVVLSRVRPAQAARVLTLLPEALATDVVMRMLRMEPVQKEVVEGVERTLRVEFMSNLSRASRREAHEMMADIFNNFDRATETLLLEALEGIDQESAERIRALMFTFEDLVRIPPQGIQVLLRTADKSQIALALKGATEEIRDLFFRNLSERAGKILREDIETLGPVRMREVEDARAALVQTAKELAAEKKIEIASHEQEELVY